MDTQGTVVTARTWARRFATGLSSLRDRDANLRRRLAALRFNPSRKHLGYAMLATPYVALWVSAFFLFTPFDAVLVILLPLAFCAWMMLAIRLLMR